MLSKPGGIGLSYQLINSLASLDRVVCAPKHICLSRLRRLEPKQNKKHRPQKKHLDQQISCVDVKSFSFAVYGVDYDCVRGNAVLDFCPINSNVTPALTLSVPVGLPRSSQIAHYYAGT